MLRVATLASGSSGNCAVVSDGRVHILIDAGISTRRIAQGLKALGLELRHISGVLITHEHTDHVAALPVLCKQTAAPLYTAEGTAFALCARWGGLGERFRVFQPGQRFAVGGLEVGTFATSHDCACPSGFSVGDGRRKLALCTDTGVVTPEAREGVRGAHTLIGEFNYDPRMLRAGPYPVHLQDRIRGERGHLSNEMGGELAAWAARQGAGRVILAHLSAENNTPVLALAAARKALGELGLGEGDVELAAAPRSEGTGWLEV
jgi:phosphoribosyl 1,2-cyclic phosphodiesterase